MNTWNKLFLTLASTCLYLLVLNWGLGLVSPVEKVSLIWLPSGLLFALLVLLPTQLWLWLLLSVSISSFLIQLASTELAALAIISFIATNLIESLAGALFFNHFCGGKKGMGAFSHLTLFLLLCVCLIPSVTGAIRALTIDTFVASVDLSQTYQAWFASVSLGILFIVPLTVQLYAAYQDKASKLYKHTRSLVAFNLMMLLLVLVSSNFSLFTPTSMPAVVYLSLPVLCWSAIKFGLVGVTTAASVFAISSIQLTALGFSPFDKGGNMAMNLVFQLQYYLAATMISSLYIGMAIDKLFKLTLKQQTLASRYQMLFDNSPISLWEEDFSAVKTFLDQQNDLVKQDINNWLEADPSRIIQCAQLVKINNINQRTLEMFKADSSESLLLKLDHIFNLDSLGAFQQEIVALYQGASQFRTEAVQRRLDGELFYTATAINLVPGFEHDWRRVVVSVEDITERKSLEDQLRQAAAVFSNTAEGILIMDLDGNLTQVNEAFCHITGYTRDEISALNIKKLKSDDRNVTPFESIWQTLQQSGYWRGEFWSVRKDGVVFPELITFNSVRNDKQQVVCYIGVFSDISNIKESEEKLEYIAHHDALTGLPNRLLFHDRLQQSIKCANRYNTKLAVVFLDVDRFKLVNDSLGHDAGDELLILVAERLVNALRSNDTVARLSGDEFTLIIEGIEMTNIERLMDKVVSVFNHDFCLKNNNISASASAGIAIYPDDGTDHDTLLKNADAAMFDAKENGRNTYHFYTAELTERAMKAVKIEGALHNAIAAEQLYLVYQPQIDLHSQKCIGVEALIRWQHPELGFVSPELFIPIAERSGLIREIGRWVINQACQQGVKWQSEGVDVGKVAVNVSGYQLQTGDLPEIVEQVLSQTKLKPTMLEIEVTESFVMKRLDLSIAQLTRIKSLGVEISIDDFGTGYSSLSYLKKLPIDKLKIDQSFIAGIPTDNNDIAITNSIISMARDLELKIIAEGVETQEQANFLASKGCLQVQGYFYSKPLEAADIGDKIKQLVKVA